MRNRDRLMEPESKDHVLFVLGAWEIHELFEDSEWVEIFHTCKRYNVVGDRMEYAYQIPGDTACPGCNEIQPDASQALEQMHNMDRPARQYGMSIVERLKRDYERMHRQGDGVDD